MMAGGGPKGAGGCTSVLITDGGDQQGEKRTQRAYRARIDRTETSVLLLDYRECNAGVTAYESTGSS